MDWVNIMHKINNKFKFQLFGRTVDNLDRLYAKTATFDPQSSQHMSSHALNLFLNSAGVFLSTQEIRSIADVHGVDGQIDYMGFVNGVRNDITQKRIAVIDHVFDSLATDAVVSLQTLIHRFQPTQHPHVRSMMKPAEQVEADFQAALRNRSADGQHLNEQEFKDLCLDMNACIPLEREEFYVDALLRGFGLLDQRITIERLKELEVAVYEKVRQKTYVKKDEGLKSSLNFKFFDMEDKGLVDYSRFVQTLDRLGCKFTDLELRALFEKHCSQPELMTYENMCGLLFEMGSGKKEVTNPIYEMAKQDGGYATSHGMTKPLH